MSPREKKRMSMLIQQGRLAEVRAILATRSETSETDADRWVIRGQLEERVGNYSLAISYYGEAVSLGCHSAELFNNLGALHQEFNSLEQAERYYRLAVEKNAELAEARYNLGVLLRKTNRAAEAIEHLRFATQHYPRYPETHLELALAFKSMGDYNCAQRHLEKVIFLRPNNAHAINILGNVYQFWGRLAEAIACYRQAIGYQPDLVEAYNNLGSAFLAQGCVTQAQEEYRKAIKLRPDWNGPYSSLLLSLNYQVLPPRTVASAHRTWAKQVCSSIPKAGIRRAVASGRRIRIGYLSPDFRTHSVAYFVEPVLAGRNSDRFEVICYSDTRSPDPMTLHLRQFADRWHDVSVLDNNALFHKIAGDGIDILVDLAGHTANNRLPLFCRKPAPVQVTFLGYPNTTGLDAMDFRITDAIADPVGQTEGLHSERLIRLPGCFLCYSPPADGASIALMSSSHSAHITYGSFNTLAKISSETLLLWSEILRLTPGAKLWLKSAGLDDPETRLLVVDRFAQLGIPETRLILGGQVASKKDHLALYAKIDVALDTFPYNGTTTTCEAVWMGVPVVTRAGDVHVSRVGASLLGAMGLGEYVASTDAEYVEKAVSAAEEVRMRVHWRRQLRAKMEASSLCDSKNYMASLEAAFAEMARRTV